jgi:hypothetical protein
VLLSFGGDLGSFRAFVGLKVLNWTIVGTVLLTRSGKLLTFSFLVCMVQIWKICDLLKDEKEKKIYVGNCCILF